MELKIRSIQSQSDYEDMVSIVDALIDAAPGSEEHKKLQIASDLVWGWEQKNVEMLPPDPIEAIKYRLDALGLSLRDLRPYIGTDARIGEVMSRKRDLTLKMVRALHTHLGIPLESLVSERASELDEDPEVGRYPLAEMMKLGWMGNFTDPKEGFEEEAWCALRNEAAADQFNGATLFRQNSNSYANAKTDGDALYAWCLHVRAVALSERLPAKLNGGIDMDFLREVARCSQSLEGPLLAKNMLNRAGVHLVVAKHLRGTFLDGVAMLLPDGSPVIGMTLRHDRLDNFYHCLLHECVHIWKHLGKQDSPSFFQDDFDVRGELNDLEKEADREACLALIPDYAIDTLGNLEFVSIGNIRRLAQQYKVSEAVVAGRIRYKTGNFSKFAKLLGYGEPSRVLGAPN